MGHNPDQVCFDCGDGTRSPRVMRCDACNVKAAKARVEKYRVARCCARCEREAQYKRQLCARCQTAHDRGRKAKEAAASKRWRKNNHAASLAAQKRSYLKHREKNLKRQQRYDRAHLVEGAAKQRRYFARTKPWSAARTAKLLAEVRAAVPATLPADVRDDVVSAILLAVFEGKLDQKKVAAGAKAFITAELRRYRDVSLDDFIPGTSVRRIDALTTEVA